MRINEFITEASKAERQRQKDAQRRAQLDAKAAEDQRIKDKMQRNLQRSLPHAITQPKQSTAATTGVWSDPRLAAYHVDPDIDTDWSGGYSLQFQPQMDGVLAYWGKGDLTPQQAQQFKQVYKFPLQWNSQQFQQLIDSLVVRSGHSGQPGYVSIAIPHQSIRTVPFFAELHKYLRREYPQNGPTVSATVNWETV